MQVLIRPVEVTSGKANAKEEPYWLNIHFMQFDFTTFDLWISCDLDRSNSSASAIKQSVTRLTAGPRRRIPLNGLFFE